MAKRLKGACQKIAERLEFERDAMEVNEDDVHFFLSAPPRYSPARVVKILKSISTRMVFKELPKIRK